jgi:hypothetical protein
MLPSSFVVVLMHHRVGGDVHVFESKLRHRTHHEAIAMRMQPLETLKTPFMVTECCLAVSSVSGEVAKRRAARSGVARGPRGHNSEQQRFQWRS